MFSRSIQVPGVFQVIHVYICIPGFPCVFQVYSTSRPVYSRFSMRFPGLFKFQTCVYHVFQVYSSSRHKIQVFQVAERPGQYMIVPKQRFISENKYVIYYLIPGKKPSWLAFNDLYYTELSYSEIRMHASVQQPTSFKQQTTKLNFGVRDIKLILI